MLRAVRRVVDHGADGRTGDRGGDIHCLPVDGVGGPVGCVGGGLVPCCGLCWLPLSIVAVEMTWLAAEAGRGSMGTGTAGMQGTLLGLRVSDHGVDGKYEQ